MGLQGSGPMVCVPTGGAGHRCNDERADGQYVLGEGRFCMRFHTKLALSSSVILAWSDVVTGSR